MRKKSFFCHDLYVLRLLMHLLSTPESLLWFIIIAWTEGTKLKLKNWKYPTPTSIYQTTIPRRESLLLRKEICWPMEHAGSKHMKQKSFRPFMTKFFPVINLFRKKASKNDIYPISSNLSQHCELSISSFSCFHSSSHFLPFLLAYQIFFYINYLHLFAFIISCSLNHLIVQSMDMFEKCIFFDELFNYPDGLNK